MRNLGSWIRNRLRAERHDADAGVLDKKVTIAPGRWISTQANKAAHGRRRVSLPRLNGAYQSALTHRRHLTRPSTNTSRVRLPQRRRTTSQQMRLPPAPCPAPSSAGPRRHESRKIRSADPPYSAPIPRPAAIPRAINSKQFAVELQTPRTITTRPASPPSARLTISASGSGRLKLLAMRHPLRPPTRRPSATTYRETSPHTRTFAPRRRPHRRRRPPTP